MALCFIQIRPHTGCVQRGELKISVTDVGQVDKWVCSVQCNSSVYRFCGGRRKKEDFKAMFNKTFETELIEIFSLN